jgi:CHASE2 domain-containing sensor protein
MPAWYDWVYALAVGAGAAGTVALLARRPAARPLYVLSLIACIAQFGYLFVTSDIIAVKGVWVIYFPAVIIAIALIQIWLAGHAQKRGWVA